MTTYYGVWSGDEWWNIGNELFRTTMIGVAKAQAMVVNAMWKRNMMHSHRRHECWTVRAIGEDGLPEPVGVSFEPFCMECKAWLERPQNVSMRDCPSCGRTLRVAYRGRRKGAKEWQRPTHIVCKPCDLEACKAVVDATELESQKCAWCGNTATGWVEMRARKWWHCDRCETWAREAMRADGFHEKEKP